VLEGLREALGTDAVAVQGGRDTAAAAAAASRAATAVVVVGLTAADEGEAFIPTDGATLKLLGPPFNRARLAGLLARVVRVIAPLVHPGGGDRRDLRLHTHDEELIRAVAAANPRTVVVLIGGSAIIAEAWRHHVPAILLAWYPGMEGGRAIADVLRGDREPGGRLPLTIPTASDHLPAFRPTATRVAYDVWWGQRKLDRDGHPAAYPLGFGLGYTTFMIMDLDVEGRGGAMLARVRVKNSGSRDGSTVVQLYAVDQQERRPIHRLVGFARVDALAGESVATAIPIDEQPISQRNRVTRTWTRRPGRWQLLAAQHAGDTAGISAPLPATR
jgi:beta-glucosidase